MSAAWTYNTLITALQDWPLARNAAYVANLPRIIGLGELRLVRDLDLEIFQVDDTVQTVAGTSTITKPTSILVASSLQVVVGTTRHPPLRQRSYAFLSATFPSTALADRARPEMYAEYSETEWFLGACPDAVYDILVRGLGRPVGLSDGNQTTWLGTNTPDALFAACLMESEHYLKADDRYEDWKKKYAEEIVPSTINELLRLKRMGDLNQYVAAKAAG